MDRATAQRWGEAIRDRRRLLGMTQEDVAAAVGTKQATVSRWERGDRMPSHHYLPKIAAALKTRPEKIFFYDMGAAA